MDDSTTIRMANQIAAFFKSYPHDVAVKEVSDHINRFWEPRMRSAFLALLASGGAGFDAIVKEAAALVKRPEDHTGPTAQHASAGQVAGGLEGGQ